MRIYFNNNLCTVESYVQQFYRAFDSKFILFVVYGWINAGRVQRVQETGLGLMFEVGYLKTGLRTPPGIELTVEDVEGTASMKNSFHF